MRSSSREKKNGRKAPSQTTVHAACMQHEVVVVAHQAVAQHLRIEARQPLLHNAQQRRAFIVVREYALAPVAARSDVLHGTGELNAQRARHQGSCSFPVDLKLKTCPRGSFHT